jgi:hypothetical protein
MIGSGLNTRNKLILIGWAEIVSQRRALAPAFDNPTLAGGKVFNKRSSDPTTGKKEIFEDHLRFKPVYSFGFPPKKIL